MHIGVPVKSGKQNAVSLDSNETVCYEHLIWIYTVAQVYVLVCPAERVKVNVYTSKKEHSKLKVFASLFKGRLLQ